MKAKSLQDLQAIQRQLAGRREASQRALAEKNLFVRAAGAVNPLPLHGRVLLQPPQPAPVAVQQQLDDQRVLHEAISDEFDASTLLDVDGALSFRRLRIGTDVTRKLRRGDWTIQRDRRARPAPRRRARGPVRVRPRRLPPRAALRARGAWQALGSPGKIPVLKGKVQSWLIQKDEVLAFVQARACDGGAGALVALLRPWSPV